MKYQVDDTIKIADLFLKKYFEFNGNVKQQISGIARGSKFASNYACVFKDQAETDLFRKQENFPLA